MDMPPRTVQNYPVPIKVKISRVFISQRPEHRADLNWKESYPKAHDRWLSEYCRWDDNPDYFDDAVRYRRCSHGCLVATDTENGNEANYCTICRPLLVSTPPRLNPYPMQQGHPLRLGLPKFPRKGVEFLGLRGTVGRHYYPGDHEICPYNPKQRMRIAEGVGGYVRSGTKDGNGIRAVRGNGPTEESLELRWADLYRPDGFVNEWRPGSFASDPSPDSGCLWIEEYLPRTSRATRLVSLDPRLDHPLSLVDFTPEPEPETGLMFAFMRRHRCEPGKPNGVQWDFFGTYVRNPFWWDPPVPGVHPLEKTLVGVLVAVGDCRDRLERPPWDIFSSWHRYRWAEHFKHPRREPRRPPHFFNVPLSPIDMARRGKEERELVRRGAMAWNKERRPYVWPGRKSWAKDWRTEERS